MVSGFGMATSINKDALKTILSHGVSVQCHIDAQGSACSNHGAVQNMESVKADFSLRKLLPRAGLEGSGHVHRDEFDRFRTATVTLEIRHESLKGVSLSTFGIADHAPGDWVMKNREITPSIGGRRISHRHPRR